MSESIQLLGISNAIVDVLAQVNDTVLEQLGVPVGSMTLIDEPRAREIYALMGPATEMSGGSVANTVAGFSNLGGSAAYIGRVRNDQFGEIFVHDMQSLGVDVRLEPATSGSPTARSHVLISADGQRTMNTYLGACTELGVDDITETTVGKPRVVLLEGYLWDIPEGPALCNMAMRIARKNGISIALSLSDSYCVERHQAAFMLAVQAGIDFIFADEDEITALFQVGEFDEVLDKTKTFDSVFVLTRSVRGSVIVTPDKNFRQAATPVARVVDSTGAGDAYTAGFLYAWTNDHALEECAKLATYCATSVIQQIGGRIEKGLLQG